jgi:hypothetical protein
MVVDIATNAVAIIVILIVSLLIIAGSFALPT